MGSTASPIGAEIQNSGGGIWSSRLRRGVGKLCFTEGNHSICGNALIDPSYSFSSEISPSRIGLKPQGGCNNTSSFLSSFDFTGLSAGNVCGDMQSNFRPRAPYLGSAFHHFQYFPTLPQLGMAVPNNGSYH